VNGPSGKGVDDLYTPEITNNHGSDATVSVVCTAANDQLKVNAILTAINGLNHDGTPGVGVPAVFGMNFQTVSVGQNLPKIISMAAARSTPGRSTAKLVVILTERGRRALYSPTRSKRLIKLWPA